MVGLLAVFVHPRPTQGEQSLDRPNVGRWIYVALSRIKKLLLTSLVRAPFRARDSRRGMDGLDLLRGENMGVGAE
jgi:hypothetical protein